MTAAYADGATTPGLIRFAALGDSVTVGLGDPMPGGGWRGWSVLLAESLAPPGRLELTNLARSGALARDVATDQLSRALAGRPTMASVVVGINDTLRGDFRLSAIAADLETAIGHLRRSGAIVLTTSLPDPGAMLRVPGLFRRPLARRIHAVNAVLDHLAARYGTVHLELARHPDLYDEGMWGVDRIHPSERGHRHLARLFAIALSEHGVPPWTWPDPRPSNPEPGAWAQARWMATKGTGWLVRRSHDLFPQLTRLALSESWHRIRDRTARLDARLRAEIDQVLERRTDPRTTSWYPPGADRPCQGPDQRAERPASDFRRR